jgi:hypothetical protein
MRQITSHRVNPVNDQVNIEVVDQPGAGGANHVYVVSWPIGTTGREQVTIRFQNGPIAENGVNGITQEVLLAIVADRLECFQRGAYACAENQAALNHVLEAQRVLASRTKKRVAQGVEGTSTQTQETNHIELGATAGGNDVVGIGYDGDAQVLAVKFRRRPNEAVSPIYHYYDVPPSTFKNVQKSLELFAKDSGKKLEGLVISSNVSWG